MATEERYLGFEVQESKDVHLSGAIYMNACNSTPMNGHFIDFLLVRYDDKGNKKCLVPISLKRIYEKAKVKDLSYFKKSDSKFYETVKQLANIDEPIILSKTAKEKLYNLMVFYNNTRKHI